ncbi:hypothetical protein DY000_02033573, partial [Brassica cretica]
MTEFQGKKFPRKLRGPPVRRKAPRNIPRENFLGIYLGRSDEMFLGIFIGNFRGSEPSENSEEQVPRYIPRNESLGIFRGTCPSVYSEGSCPRNL